MATKILSNLHRVKVWTEGDGIFPTHVEVDGERVPCCSIDFHQDTETVPTCTLEVPASTDLDVLAEATYVRPATTRELFKELREAFLSDEELYKGLVASIGSVLREWVIDEDRLAEAIADRIIMAEHP